MGKPTKLSLDSNSTGISGRVNKIVGTPTREILFVLFSKGMVHSHEFKNENLSKYTVDTKAYHIICNHILPAVYETTFEVRLTTLSTEVLTHNNWCVLYRNYSFSIIKGAMNIHTRSPNMYCILTREYQ